MTTVKRKIFSKEERLQVYNKCNGHCAYCGCKLDYKDMQIDHVVAIDSGGTNDYDNLLPSCRMCNKYKNTFTLEEFRRQLGLLQGRLEKVYIYRLSKKYNLLEETPHEVKFYFEKLKKVEE